MIRQVTITWGSMYLLGNPEDKQDRPSIPNFMAPEHPKKMPSLEDFEFITRSIFIKMFQKPLLHLGIRNAISLLDMAKGQLEKDIEFIKNYPKDEISQHFEVLKLQREYLYQAFNEVPKRGQEKKPVQNEMISPAILCQPKRGNNK
jgi:Fe-S cluster assembly ATPase SufC